MKMTHLARAATIFAAAALGLTACSTDPHTDNTAGNAGSNDPNRIEPGYFPQSDDGGDPVPGGTLTYAEFTEVRSWDPTMIIPTSAGGGNPMVAIYDQLLRQNPETEEFEPRIAELVEHNDDFTEWTITLRPNITFSDGTPLDADAVVGSMNYYMSSMAYDVSLISSQWEGIEATGDLTVVIKLKDSWATFDRVLARGLGFIVAPAAIAGGAERFRPIGAGPFLAGDYAPGESMTFKPNPTHWDGAPYIDELRFVWLGADQTKWDSFRGNSVQGTFINDADIINEILTEDLPRSTYISSNGMIVSLNHQEGHPASFPKVRKAMALATDPSVVTERVFGGMGMTGKLQFAPTSRWYDETVPVNEHDPEAAAQLVEEAKAEGFDGTIPLISTDSPSYRETALLFKGQWEAAGFTVESETTRSVADFIAKLYVERSYSTALTGMQVMDNDPYLNLYASWHSKAVTNIAYNNDPEMDALLDELRVTPLDDAKDVLHRIEVHYQEAVPAITYGYLTPTTVWQQNVYGVTPLNEGMVDFGKAWIKP